MPWREAAVIDERVKFVREYDRRVLSGEISMSELCEEHGIARKTGYKMVRRRNESGWPGLADRSRAPHSGVHWTDADVIMRVLELRLKFPHWGAETIVAYLRLQEPDAEWPGVGAAHRWISQAGLLRSAPRHRRFSHPGPPEPAQPTATNEQWSTDFKGHFRTRDGRYCYPLTIADTYSRYLLSCQSLLSTSFEATWPVFERVFREYGLPQSILSDNGTPFSSRSVKRLSRLSVRWIRLGIRPRLTQPGNPQQNGRHERIHGHMKPLVCSEPSRNCREQQKQFDWFHDHHNNVRPNAGCDGRLPADLYSPSPRPYPKRLPTIEYPSGFEVRKVRSSGDVLWQGQWFFLSEALVGEPIAFEPVDTGCWIAHYGPLELGYYSAREKKLHLDRSRPARDGENA
jgi:putative transposase